VLKKVSMFNKSDTKNYHYIGFSSDTDFACDLEP